MTVRIRQLIAGGLAEELLTVTASSSTDPMEIEGPDELLMSPRFGPEANQSTSHAKQDLATDVVDILLPICPL